ncbi:hypothetical protein BSK54_10370 [Paenibacillus odorifer]|uniref:hypothetical protein n=1 Tax=Paenibacillus odorifer TaxID=189426 RepID=UPI00096ED77F|nr:hypothetical protein [Paenibacillus odorifer]OME02654.1 hypothetical protein BSK54_10370 [Paenibacillus odorifer]
MIDKATEKRIIKSLRQINLMLFLERSNDETACVMSLVENMPALEQEVIRKEYLITGAEYTRHYEIYKDMAIAEGTYTKIRMNALYKVGVGLGIIDSELKNGK